MSRRGVAVALGCAAVTMAFVPAVAGAAKVPDSQTLAVLLHDHAARTSPSSRAHRIESVAATRPLTHVRTVLPVLGRRTTAGHTWLHVALPGRPNGHKGWILADRTRRSSTAWHIVVRLAARTLTLYQDGIVNRTFAAIVGAPSTPTPRGRFFVEEALALTTQDPGGPFALATSARSDVLQEFDGGPGQIGIHGMYNLAGELGTAVSHGCIRLATAAITWLAERIGAGVPLTITS